MQPRRDRQRRVSVCDVNMHGYRGRGESEEDRSFLCCSISSIWDPYICIMHISGRVTRLVRTSSIWDFMLMSKDSMWWEILKSFWILGGSKQDLVFATWTSTRHDTTRFGPSFHHRCQSNNSISRGKRARSLAGYMLLYMYSRALYLLYIGSGSLVPSPAGAGASACGVTMTMDPVPYAES